MNMFSRICGTKGHKKFNVISKNKKIMESWEVIVLCIAAVLVFVVFFVFAKKSARTSYQRAKESSDDIHKHKLKSVV
jgi:phosphotransferase system  glucose/maltose/N-acetylglucosamine-specific IIC component